ncbi:alcohol dehydrogenase catalytic domain-containing protein [Microbacterium sp. W1N]|uniref:alcohol dehydrogenase catalytic domain-containing protein n=1 Tax=Microbacterium festucae TaxID=2977531 RepID=UPI0021C0300E|nr:alcohol dehydrogenase catalytic domain-containing protein [Microbacterium festucae]MCT9821399.1 alcohol dehydrogenase catalytic domain-containing protein [Microbacterium festucae]
MKALTWQGRRRVEVLDVPDPRIELPTDAIVRVTSTAICGSDLHLYELFGPFLDRGDILGHETMGIVEEVGSEVRGLRPGQRVVVPFNISCGECFMCVRGLQSQCETTQVREYGSGASLFGYTKLYGQVPGGQAELLRVPLADYNTVPVGDDLPDDRYLFLSDILPTAWQGVDYAHVPAGGSLVVVGLGPVGQFAARVGRHLGYEVIGIDPVSERREMAARHGVHTLDEPGAVDAVLEATHGRGADGVVDAVGMEAHGNPVVSAAHHVMGALPDAIAQPLMQTAGLDRTAALLSAIDMVRRGGTVSLSGVYAGEADPMPMKTLFDKQVTLRMGQCNVKRWTDMLLPLVEAPDDPLGTEDLVTHRPALTDAAAHYELFQKKADGCIKVVLQPGAAHV